MKKILIFVLILLLAFVLVRITTSTYENAKRQEKTKMAYITNAI